MPLYNYECSCGTRFAELQKIDERGTCRCPNCQALAPLVITAAPALDSRMGLDSGFPTAVDRFERVHRQKAKQEEKALAG